MIKETPKLTSLLQALEAQHKKLAEDSSECPECSTDDEGSLAKAVADAIEQDTSEAHESTATEDATEALEKATEEMIDAKDALKAVAEEFIDAQNDALKKEAQVFGEIFGEFAARSMKKTAAVSELEEEVYNSVYGHIQQQDLMTKCASMYEDAYMHSMAKLAGYDSPEDMQAAMGATAPMTPEQAVAAAQAAQAQAQAAPAPAPEPMPEPEPEPASEYQQALIDALSGAATAADTNAQAITAIADAAQSLADTAAAPMEDPTAEIPQAAPAPAPAPAPQPDVNLPAMQQEAYNKVASLLRSGQYPMDVQAIQKEAYVKTASAIRNQNAQVDVNGIQKEAYVKTASAVRANAVNAKIAAMQREAYDIVKNTIVGK